MSKGTTTQGLVEGYFANIFGPPQYRALLEGLAERYLKAMFKAGLFVGQMRTMLGNEGEEMSGPEQSARALLEMIKENAGRAE